MTESDHNELLSVERPTAESPESSECDNIPANAQNHKLRKTRAKDKQAEDAELRLRALQTDFRRVEAERNLLEKRRRAVHASYCMVFALIILAAIVIVPKLQRSSYLKGYDEGVRQAVQSETRQTKESSPAKQANPVPEKLTDPEPILQPDLETTEQRIAPVESIPAAASEVETEPVSTIYIGNKNSKKFHLPTCSSLPAEKNQVFFESREDALESGYSPCGSCQP